MTNPMNDEPVATLGAAVLAVIVAGIALLPAFGIEIDTAQQGALIAFVTALITLVTLWQRQSVYSPNTVRNIRNDAQDAVNKAYVANPATDPKPTIAKR